MCGVIFSAHAETPHQHHEASKSSKASSFDQQDWPAWFAAQTCTWVPNRSDTVEARRFININRSIIVPYHGECKGWVALLTMADK